MPRVICALCLIIIILKKFYMYILTYIIVTKFDSVGRDTNYKLLNLALDNYIGQKLS